MPHLLGATGAGMIQPQRCKPTNINTTTVTTTVAAAATTAAYTSEQYVGDVSESDSFADTADEASLSDYTDKVHGCAAVSTLVRQNHLDKDTNSNMQQKRPNVTNSNNKVTISHRRAVVRLQIQDYDFPKEECKAYAT